MSKTKGGVKYTSPSNMPDRLEMAELLKELNITGFRQFILEKSQDPALKLWAGKSDEELLLLMHEFRSQNLSMGEAFVESRNFLRSRQFGYTAEELAFGKQKCGSCLWFRESTPDLEPCMYLGSYQEDICCKAFKAAKSAKNVV